MRICPEDTEAKLRMRVQNGEYIIYPEAIAWFAAARIELQKDTVILDGKPLAAPIVIDEEC